MDASQAFLDFFADELNSNRNVQECIEAAFINEAISKHYGTEPNESLHHMLFPYFDPGTAARKLLESNAKIESDKILQRVKHHLRQTRTATVLYDLVKNIKWQSKFAMHHSHQGNKKAPDSHDYSQAIEIIYSEVSSGKGSRNDYLELQLSERSFHAIMDLATEPGTPFLAWLEQQKIHDEKEILEFWASIWSELEVTQEMLDEESKFRKRMIWEIPYMTKADGLELRQHFEEPEDEWYERYMMCFLSSSESEDENQPFEKDDARGRNGEFLHNIREKARKRLMAFLLAHLVPGDPFRAKLR